jgi:PAS domain S-box-containing protein
LFTFDQCIMKTSSIVIRCTIFILAQLIISLYSKLIFQLVATSDITTVSSTIARSSDIFQLSGSLLVFGIVLFPAIRRLYRTNSYLIDLNRHLTSTNSDLRAREEQINADLDNVFALQKHLEIKENQFRKMVEDANDMMYELDENGKFSYVNPIMEAICEWPKDELLQKHYWEIVRPDRRPQVIEFYSNQRCAGLETSYLELNTITGSGREIWVGQNARMFFDGARVKKVSVIARDITDLIKAREALMDSEARFRTLAKDAPVGIFQTDKLGACFYVNKRWCEITGMDEQSSLGTGWADGIHVDDRTLVFQEWFKAVDEKREFDLEYRFSNGELGTRWVHGHAVVIVDSQGALSGFIGTINDITALKNAERELFESEKRYRLVSEHSKDLIALHEPDGSYTYVSGASSNLLGYEPKELIGVNTFTLIHPDDLRGPNIVTLGDTQSIQFRMRRKDGSYIWVESHSEPIADKHGVITAVQTSTRDITTRKEFEEQLKASKEKAEEATRAKSQFLSPMNAIIGLTNLLLKEKPRSDQYESLKLLKFSGENLLTIINDILDFSKIEAGKIVLEWIDTDLRALLDTIVQMLGQRAGEKGINLQFKYDENVPRYVKVDPVRIGQIVTNLLSNAIKFTERGYVKLEVTSDRISEGINLINFSVEDSGIGIEQEKIKQVFESFSQASTDTTRKFGGTGLGLSITKRLLALMDSDVVVSSRLGVGSKFSFRVSLEEIIPSNMTTHDVSHDDAESLRRNARILLVEDNRVNQIVATSFLKKWKLNVDVVNNGREALLKITSNRYQLVLMDLQMPEMDGYEATRKIRLMNDNYFKRLPILALTASAMTDIREGALAAGMTDFISKPFQPEELKVTIGKYLLGEREVDSKAYIPAATTLDLYADGDPEFKLELAMVLGRNIAELQESLRNSIDSKDASIYDTACHKMKVAIGMLGDQEFSGLIEDLRMKLTEHNLLDADFAEKNERFSELCQSIITGLEEEIKSL